eukprot:scaffold48808_cov57-Phaeocystis_antarctica.AAC.3
MHFLLRQPLLRGLDCRRLALGGHVQSRVVDHRPASPVASIECLAPQVELGARVHAQTPFPAPADSETSVDAAAGEALAAAADAAEGGVGTAAVDCKLPADPNALPAMARTVRCDWLLRGVTGQAPKSGVANAKRGADETHRLAKSRRASSAAMVAAPPMMVTLESTCAAAVTEGLTMCRRTGSSGGGGDDAVVTMLDITSTLMPRALEAAAAELRNRESDSCTAAAVVEAGTAMVATITLPSGTVTSLRPRLRREALISMVTAERATPAIAATFVWMESVLIVPLASSFIVSTTSSVEGGGDGLDGGEAAQAAS